MTFARGLVIPATRLVLIVEDNEGYSYLTRRLLRSINPALNVRIANSAHEALLLIEQEQPHLLLLDLIMPTISGLELLQRLKSRADTARIPAIVLTGYADDQRVRDAYQQFANAFLVKPDMADDLQVVLTALNDFWFKHALLPPAAPVMSDQLGHLRLGH